MACRTIRRLFSAALMVLIPLAGYAQEATLSGTIADTTGAVLPGVTVTARHLASGNVFETVSDERGTFRIPVRTGNYDVTAALPGFSTVVQSGLEILVGQIASVNLQMAPSAIEEAVTVTGEAPLVDVSSSTLSGNIDPRQMSELPLNGRNWLDLTLLAPGNRSNAVNNGDIMARGNATYSKLNIDGQEVSAMQAAGGFGQPGFARDAIGEFEFVANRFDATQGRSAGVQVNAITKSGTNTYTGTAGAYFRDSSFIAKDFVADRVLPYSDQQFSVTFGGPIRKDRVHFFAHYEYEREPQTFTFNTPVPSFNTDLTGTRSEPKSGVRTDWQLSPRTRLMARANFWQNNIPYDPRYTGGAARTPSGTEELVRKSREGFATFTQVLTNRAVNEVRGGYADFGFAATPIAKWATHPTAAANTHGAPQINFNGLRIGQDHTPAPQDITQHTYSIRDDFTYSSARHTVKIGGEFLHMYTNYFQCTSCMGIYDAQGGPRPSPEQLAAWFPDILDVTTWRLDLIPTALVRSYQRGIGTYVQHSPREIGGAWIQEDWKPLEALTVNLGLRYDRSVGAFAEDREMLPWLAADRPSPTTDFGPRIGFAYRPVDRTVIRGGWGKYFGDVSDQISSWTIRYSGEEVLATVTNTGRPDFAANPFNGSTPTFEQVISTPGFRRSVTQIATPTLEMPYSYQASIGMQRQLADTMAVEADYVINKGRQELFTRNINLTYNPATGANYPWTDATRALYPDWGTVGAYLSEGSSDYDAFQLAWTKRYSNRWQASATYTLARLKDGRPSPAPDINLAEDLAAEYGPADTDQTHRAVFNGIVDLGYGFQVSGLYFYGSGVRYATSYGSDLRLVGTGGSNRLRPNGTIVARNDFMGDPLHRVDMRLQRRFAFGRRSIDAIAEVFNVFNHANYGSYTTTENNANYGKPNQVVIVAYQPRMAQFGFRVSF